MHTGFDPEGRCLDSKQDWERPVVLGVGPVLRLCLGLLGAASGEQVLVF